MKKRFYSDKYQITAHITFYLLPVKILANKSGKEVTRVGQAHGRVVSGPLGEKSELQRAPNFEKRGSTNSNYGYIIPAQKLLKSQQYLPHSQTYFDQGFLQEKGENGLPRANVHHC